MKKTVLIVDDEKDVVRFLTMALEDAGFDVLVANNGVEALEILKKNKPDLISLDVVMPGGSGLKFHRELKKNTAWTRIPVLVVTGHARDDLGKADFAEMTISGPGVYLEKPVTADTYVNAINKILGIEEKEDISSSTVKNEVKALLNSTDPETLKEVLRIMKSKKDK
ncbi:MAG: response regulator [Chitinispirillia bacterium]